MFQFSIGIIIGFFIAFILMSILFSSGIKYDINLMTNIIIAFATAVATCIHFDSVSKQRRDRVWEINKQALLELAHSLSQVINSEKYYLALEYASLSHEHLSPTQEKPKANVYRNFFEKQENVLQVYRSLMDRELIDAIEKVKKRNAVISDAVMDNQIHHIEAYEESIENHESLQCKLHLFITKMSGVDNM